MVDKKFEENGSCVARGLYFTNEKYILEFLEYGIYLKEVELPSQDPEFKMVCVPYGAKWGLIKLFLENDGL